MRSSALLSEMLWKSTATLVQVRSSPGFAHCLGRPAPRIDRCPTRRRRRTLPRPPHLESGQSFVSQPLDRSHYPPETKVILTVMNRNTSNFFTEFALHRSPNSRRIGTRRSTTRDAARCMPPRNAFFAKERIMEICTDEPRSARGRSSGSRASRLRSSAAADREDRAIRAPRTADRTAILERRVRRQRLRHAARRAHGRRGRLRELFRRRSLDHAAAAERRVRRNAAGDDADRFRAADRALGSLERHERRAGKLRRRQDPSRLHERRGLRREERRDRSGQSSRRERPSRSA